jgi:hypothetical protein
MTDLLDQVLAAHGGLDRWARTRRLRVRAHVTGELWGRRGQPGALRDAHLEIDPHAQRVVFHRFKARGRRAVFEPRRVVIETQDGQVIDERLDPGSAFSGQTATSAWDDLSLAYAAGFDLWHYLTGPFMLTTPGVQVEEAGPWEEAGEQWRRLRAVFPEGLVAHARQQLYAFNHAGLLRRFEYLPERSGVPANVNYAAGHRHFGGLVIPTRRRMLPLDPDGRARPEPVLMAVDVLDVQVETSSLDAE